MKYRLLIFAVVIGLLAIYVGQFATLPVPDGLPEPWKMRAFALVRHAIHWIGKLLVPSNLSRTVIKGVRQGVNSTRNVTDCEFDGVPVRIFLPPVESPEPLPALIYLHGGGWVQGGLDTSFFFANDIAVKLDQVMLVVVDYRLAPLHRYPAAVNDCTKATVWLINNTDEYNVDSNQIAIFGDSAGGNLAAAVTQRLTYDSAYSSLPAKLKLQVLIYPALQAFDFNMPSYRQYGEYETLFLTKQLMSACWSMYLKGDVSLVMAFATNNHTSSSAKRIVAEQGILSYRLIPDDLKNAGNEPETDDLRNSEILPEAADDDDKHIFGSIKESLMNPDLAPLMRVHLAGLPETYIVTCNFDVLRDDGVLYARRLKDAAVAVVWKHYAGGTHGSMIMNHDGLFALEAGRQIRLDLVTYLKENLVNIGQEIDDL